MPWSASNLVSSAHGYGVCSVTMRRQCASCLHCWTAADGMSLNFHCAFLDEDVQPEWGRMMQG